MISIQRIKHLYRRYKTLLHLVIIFVLFTTVYYVFESSYYFDNFVEWAGQNFVLLCVVLFILRAAAIIWPPISAVVILYGMIPVIGWLPVLIIDYLGEVVGSLVAYLIARKYGEKLLTKMFDEQTIHKIKSVKIKEGNEFEMLMLMRFIGWTFFDLVCYGAGILKVKFTAFLWSTLLANLIISSVSIFFVYNLLSPDNFYINAILLVIGIAFFWKIKGRYLEVKSET